MKTGTIDVRTRDTERHGKMRVDQLCDMLHNLKPAPSEEDSKFYQKVWNLDDYKDFPAPEVQKIEEKKEDVNAPKKDFSKKEAPAKKEAPPKKEK